VKTKTIVIFVTIVVVLISGIVGIFLYNSMIEENSVNNAVISFKNLAMATEDSKVFLDDLSIYRKFRFTLIYDVTGGSIPLSCRDFSLIVKIEDFQIGSTRINNFILQTGSESKTETYILDLSSLSSNDISYVKKEFYDFNKEIKVEVQGSATINASAKSKNINPQISKYFLFDSPQITIGRVYWEKTYASIGEVVNFHVELSNPYRAHETYGTLKVEVIDDYGYGYGYTTLRQSYSGPMSLNVGQSRDYVQPFTVFSAGSIRGWFLKVYWNGNLLYTMDLDSPPELRHPWT
jgi:hypothetical protein